MHQAIAYCGSHRGPKVVFRLGPHFNEGLELVSIRKGSTTWFVEDQVYAVEAGQLFFTLPWEKHGGLARQEPGLEIDWIDLRTGTQRGQLKKPRGLDLPLDVWQKAARCFLESPTRCVASTPDITRALARIVKWHFEDSPTSRARLMHQLPILLLDAADAVSRGASPAQRVQDRATTRVLSCLADIRRDPSHSVDLNTLSSACGLGRTRFADLVKRHTGDSPIQYVNRLRIERACRLLEESDRPVTDIAHESGFESSQYFARIFRAFQSCSASEYRRRVER